MMDLQTLIEDERAVNTAVGYVIAIAITTVLLAMLISATTDFVRVQQHSVVETEMNIVGQDLADHLTDSDRLVRMYGADETTLNRHVSLPSDLAGAQYAITVDEVEATEPHAGDHTYRLQLRTNSPVADEEVYFVSKTDIEPTTVNGGDLRIVYDESEDKLVIRYA